MFSEYGINGTHYGNKLYGLITKGREDVEKIVSTLISRYDRLPTRVKTGLKVSQIGGEFVLSFGLFASFPYALFTYANWLGLVGDVPDNFITRGQASLAAFGSFVHLFGGMGLEAHTLGKAQKLYKKLKTTT